MTAKFMRKYMFGKYRYQGCVVYMRGAVKVRTMCEHTRTTKDRAMEDARALLAEMEQAA